MRSRHSQFVVCVYRTEHAGKMFWSRRVIFHIRGGQFSSSRRRLFNLLGDGKQCYVQIDGPRDTSAIQQNSLSHPGEARLQQGLQGLCPQSIHRRLALPQESWEYFWDRATHKVSRVCWHQLAVKWLRKSLGDRTSVCMRAGCKVLR